MWEKMKKIKKKMRKRKKKLGKERKKLGNTGDNEEISVKMRKICLKWGYFCFSN